MKKAVSRKIALILFSCFFLQSNTHLFAQRLYGGYYTEEKISNARSNCTKFEWAGKIKEAAVKNAASWITKTDEELWLMIPGQDLPRCIDVTLNRADKNPTVYGCLKCGKEVLRFGSYPYNPDFVSKPWKLTCPSCGEIFPKNDFGKYYASGIDEHGLFDPHKADRNLLFNTDHPDANDPLHKFGVDDGYGYTDSSGHVHRYIGYYVWKYWDYINNGLGALANAYLYSGEKKYAHKAAVLLDRIADVYPDMDWKPYAEKGWYHSDGGAGNGKIGGSIWETNVAQHFADSYDKIISGTINDDELCAFLKRQPIKYQLPAAKGSRALLIRNIDDRILRTSFNAVLSGQIRGNQGMHQMTVAKCALALNTEPETSQWLDWLFAPDGGAIPGLMISRFDHDGTSDEGAPGYAFYFGNLISEIAEIIEGYKDYTHHNIFKEYPQLKASFSGAWRMAVSGKAIPNMGDAGATGLVSIKPCDPQFIAKGFSVYGDTALAVAAYRANGNSAKGLGYQVFSKDPEALSKEIQGIAEKAGARPVNSSIMSGYGLATLESGSSSNTVGVAINYGRSLYHGHPDVLNFDLFAFDHWLAPDQGYPEYATKWPSNQEWTGSTLSHNLVYVNQHPQKEVWGGYTKLFKQTKGFSVVELDGKTAYPEINNYSRSMFLIGGADAVNDSNVYIVDIFCVKGGFDHLYSFHGPPGAVTVKGLRLNAQLSGTYAGENIQKGEWAKNFPVGYSHLYNVERDKKPSAGFMIDWKAETGYRGIRASDDIHLRFHALTACDDVAIANGDPPQNKVGNPKTLKYVLMHRKGEDLSSHFISVIEPYRKIPFIKTVRLVEGNENGTIVIEIEKTNGITDYVLFNADSSNHISLKNKITLNGRIGYVSMKKEEVQRAVLVNGQSLIAGKINLQQAGAYKGRVVQMNKALTGGGWVVVDKQLPVADSLKGEIIIIKTKGERDAAYTIEKIEQVAAGSKIYCGDIHFIRDYKGEKMMVRLAKVPKDYDQGFEYDFEEGADFIITNHKTYSKQQ